MPTWLVIPSAHPAVFTSMPGLRVGEFDALVRDLLPRYQAAARARLSRPTRQRAIGAGHPFELTARDQILLTVVRLRVYPTDEVLGYRFDISDTTAGRTVTRLLPLLEAAGLDSMRTPDPGRKRRRQLDELLANTPEGECAGADGRHHAGGGVGGAGAAARARRSGRRLGLRGDE